MEKPKIPFTEAALGGISITPHHGIRRSFERWIPILRQKASEFEHKQPIEDRVHPTLDSICNEMEAYLNGFMSR